MSLLVCFDLISIEYKLHKLLIIYLCPHFVESEISDFCLKKRHGQNTNFIEIIRKLYVPICILILIINNI